MQFKGLFGVLLLGVGAGTAITATGMGAIVNGVDTFDGTSIDTSTYNVFNQDDQTSLVQNNALIFSVPTTPHVTGITTIFPAVGVGGGAQVHITLRDGPPANEAAFLGLALTTDNDEWYGVDPYTVFAEVNWGLGAFFAEYRENVAPYGLGTGSAIPAGADDCIVRIERLSSTLIQTSLLDDSGQMLAEEDQACVANSDLLHVQIAAQGLDITADNLELFGNFVPEPGAFAIATALAIICGISRRRQRAW